MIGNFRKRDTLEIFKETWNTNHKKININKMRLGITNNNRPTNQAKRVTIGINRNNYMKGK